MPTTLDDLATGLQSFFADRFPLGGDGGPGSVLLVFDPLGHPLSVREFGSAVGGGVGGLLAHQRAAALADQIPAANALGNGSYVPRGGSALSRWYRDLVRGSNGPPASNPDARAAFETAKTEAINALANCELVLAASPDGSPLPAGVNVRYYATSMVPVDWFEPGSDSWQTYSVGAAENPPPDHQAPWYVPVPPREYRRIPPVGPEEDPFIWPEEIPPHLRQLRAVINPAVTDFVRAATLTEGGVDDADDEVGIGLDVTPIATPIATAAGAARGRLLNAVVNPELAAAAGRVVLPVDETVVHSPTFRWNPAAIDVLAEVSVIDSVLAGTTSEKSTSSNFSVRFDYCLVRFDRPWWDDAFLARNDWQVPGYEAHQLSSGRGAEPHDPLTLITVGMLVVRNLRVTAEWSESDIDALPRSTSLGPFCIAAAEFDSATGTLSRDGHQAIAWLCQVPPPLPPL
ncbi:hypothetical protein [Mycolicibacterium elephantis]|uniref:Uncharacterized protein n=1 Tax=Mycolicibacterium elephantis DSM 44368 TaxID=1335622 RepID=A0A439DUH8_9MYCO|nr:hypothetical protein [Mycolicibacterium elephantis]MCV7221178.1 hypothetical protein [Mycolicibacterium elephantis]RWA20312.1 hypothetical protein MELE44368_17605 [Mycolicibacterium elephantis DSM 44368]